MGISSLKKSPLLYSKSCFLMIPVPKKLSLSPTILGMFSQNEKYVPFSQKQWVMRERANGRREATGECFVNKPFILASSAGQIVIPFHVPHVFDTISQTPGPKNSHKIAMSTHTHTVRYYVSSRISARVQCALSHILTI